MTLKTSLSLFALVCGILFAGLTAPTRAEADECEATCANGDDKVNVDLQKKCMCVGEDCFKIDIGTAGPSMTTDGTPSEKLEGCEGAKFQAKSTPTTSYDNDCLKMGIPANDSVGKWVHKTSNCKQGGSEATKGCIAVPCDKWPDLVKKAKGKMSIAVCGGGKSGGGSGGGGGSSGGGSSGGGSSGGGGGGTR